MITLSLAVGEDGMDATAELAVAQRRLRRRTLWILGTAAAAVALAIGAIVYANRPGPEIPDIEKPFLWRVEGASGPSYLFGTLHIGYSVGDLPRAVLAAQEAAPTTVVESDLLSELPSTQRTADQGRSRLAPDEWRELADMTGVPEEKLVTWDTSRLIGSVIRALAPRVEPMDRGLQQRARTLGKSLVFLEDRTLEGVMDERALLAGLTEAVRNRAQFRAALVSMVRRYATGEEDGCAADSAGLAGALVEDLNRTWTGKIEDELGRGGAFVAIGCAHLVGPRSVIARLRAHGLRVERVEP